MKKKVSKKPARIKRAQPKRKVKRKMATATAEAPPKKEETEKEKADRELKEFNEKNPSGLPVPAPQNEVDRLQVVDGVNVVDLVTAGLPGGGPANNFGMSAGGPVPTKDDVQNALDQLPPPVKYTEAQKKAQEKKPKAEKSAPAHAAAK